MEQKIKISVVVPVYNVEGFLPRCLDSIINQTLREIEIICINDGSPDNCLKILEEYARKDERIVIANQENQGVSCARNKGMKLAQGEYISFIDADDYIDNEFLAKLYYNAVAYKADVALSGIFWHRYRDEVWLLYNEHLKIAKKVDDIFNLCDMPKLNYVWNKIYKREFLLSNEMFF